MPFAAIAPLALRLVLAHVALGVAQGALAEARDLSRVVSHTRPRGSGESLLALSPGAEADLLPAVGELVLAAHSASAVVGRATSAMAETLRAGRALDAEQRAATAALVAAAEAVTVKAALFTGERVLDIAGAYGLDRFWRNTRVLADRGPAGPALRVIGDRFLHCDAVTSVRLRRERKPGGVRPSEPSAGEGLVEPCVR